MLFFIVIQWFYRFGIVIVFNINVTQKCVTLITFTN